VLTPTQVAAVGTFISTAESEGLLIVGGIEAIVNLIRAPMSEADRQQAIADVMKDAQARSDTRAKILAAAAAQAPATAIRP
jgi:hypothetical protein